MFCNHNLQWWDFNIASRIWKRRKMFAFSSSAICIPFWYFYSTFQNETSFNVLKNATSFHCKLVKIPRIQSKSLLIFKIFATSTSPRKKNRSQKHPSPKSVDWFDLLNGNATSWKIPLSARAKKKERTVMCKCLMTMQRFNFIRVESFHCVATRKRMKKGVAHLLKVLVTHMCFGTLVKRWEKNRMLRCELLLANDIWRM